MCAVMPQYTKALAAMSVPAAAARRARTGTMLTNVPGQQRTFGPRHWPSGDNANRCSTQYVSLSWGAMRDADPVGGRREWFHTGGNTSMPCTTAYSRRHQGGNNKERWQRHGRGRRWWTGQMTLSLLQPRWLTTRTRTDPKALSSHSVLHSIFVTPVAMTVACNVDKSVTRLYWFWYLVCTSVSLFIVCV